MIAIFPNPIWQTRLFAQPACYQFLVPNNNERQIALLNFASQLPVQSGDR